MKNMNMKKRYWTMNLQVFAGDGGDDDPGDEGGDCRASDTEQSQLNIANRPPGAKLPRAVFLCLWLKLWSFGKRMTSRFKKAS